MIDQGIAVSFKWKLLALAILPLIAATVGVAWVVLWQSGRLAEQQTALLEASLMEQKRTELRHAIALISGELDVLAAEHDEARAAERAKDLIRAAHYGEDGYFFAYDRSGTCLVHPRQPELVGKNLWELRDPSGRRVIPALVETAERGSGFQRYGWSKPSTGRITEKLAYVALLPRFDWVLGTGVYLDDVAAASAVVRKEAHASVGGTMWRLAGVALLAIAVVFTSTLALGVNEQRLADSRLRVANERLATLRTREEARTERELHEGVLQVLAAAKFQLELAEQKLQSGVEDAPAVLGVGLERLRTAITDVRGIAHRRGPVALERLGWARALEELTHDFAGHFRIEFENGLELAPPEPYARELYRIVQECLTNAARHAEASVVTVSIERSSAGELLLVVIDDGHGFDPARVDEDERAGVGLRHLGERVEDLNGTLRVESRPGRTEVMVSLRLDPLP